MQYAARHYGSRMHAPGSRKRADGETGRWGDGTLLVPLLCLSSRPVPASPRLPVSPSPRLPVPASPHPPVSPSPRLPVSPLLSLSKESPRSPRLDISAGEIGERVTCRSDPHSYE